MHCGEMINPRAQSCNFIVEFHLTVRFVLYLFVGEVREGPGISPVIFGEGHHRCWPLLNCELGSESREERIVGRVYIIVVQLWRWRLGGFLCLQLVSLSSEVCSNISHSLWSVLTRLGLRLGLRLVAVRSDVDGRVPGQFRVVNCEGRVRAGAGVEADRELVRELGVVLRLGLPLDHFVWPHVFSLQNLHGGSNCLLLRDFGFDFINKLLRPLAKMVGVETPDCPWLGFINDQTRLFTEALCFLLHQVSHDFTSLGALRLPARRPELWVKIVPEVAPLPLSLRHHHCRLAVCLDGVQLQDLLVCVELWPGTAVSKGSILSKFCPNIHDLFAKLFLLNEILLGCDQRQSEDKLDLVPLLDAAPYRPLVSAGLPAVEVPATTTTFKSRACK